jgi:putative transposase
MVRRAAHCETGDRRPVASSRLSPLLALAIPSAFLANHREVIVACDLFTVPTLTFQLLSCFFVIEHRRRMILHVNVTREPTPAWVVQQLRDVFPGDGPHRFMLLDHDSTFDGNVTGFLKATGLDPTRTAIQAPWQNGVAERWVGSCRRDLLDQIIALNERHLHRLIREYVDYYDHDRIHDALEKDTPDHRAVESKPSADATVMSTARAGGLHHRYSWRDAA